MTRFLQGMETIQHSVKPETTPSMVAQVQTA
jgi:hypothetical protein